MSGLVLAADNQPQFTAAAVAESSSVQLSFNTLMFLLAANTPIPAGATVVITGLTNSRPLPSAMYALSGMHPFYFARDFVFDKAAGSLTLRVIKSISANVNVMFALEVMNEAEGIQAHEVRVEASCDAGARTCPEGWHLPSEVMKSTDGVLRSNARAQFTSKSIGQKIPYAGENNVLTVTLATNVEYRTEGGEQASITISGLTLAAADVGAMKLGGSHPFGNGRWSAGSLQFDVVDDMSAGRDYVLSFEVRNPGAAQASPAVSVASSWGTSEAMEPDVRSLLAGIFEARPGDAAPLYVRTEQFFQADIGQTSPYPCAINVICITLQPSVPLSEAEGVTFSVSKLLNAEIANVGGVITVYNDSNVNTPAVAVKAAGADSVPGTADWDPRAAFATVTFTVACKIDAGEVVTLCLKVKNPTAPQWPTQGEAITMKLGNVGQQMRLDNGNLDDVAFDADMDHVKHPMYIRTPRFLMLDGKQSSPFPSDDNTVSISMRTNVPLLAACNVAVTVSGLQGTQTPFGPLNLTSAGPFDLTARFEPSFSLVQQLVADTDAGSDYDWTFMLQNIRTPDAVGNVMVEVSGIAIPARAVETHADVATGVTYCSQIQPPEPGCGHGTAVPVTVVESKFIVKKIGQSTPWPGATNTLTLTLAANMVLRGNDHAKLLITNLVNSRWDAPYLVGDTNFGVFCNTSIADTYVMFSHEDTRLRFPAIDDGNAAHFVCAKYNSATPAGDTSSASGYADWATTWSYYTGVGTWVAFTPVPSDLLVASVHTPDPQP